MKLCESCLEELFDSDVICPKCNSDKLICDDELNRVKKELMNSKEREKQKLLVNSKYLCVHNYMIKKEKGYMNYLKTTIPSDKHTVEVVNPSYENSLKKTKAVITCPYCQSTDCKKISGLSKAGSVALWGIFSLGKTTRQWHCNNCKSDF